MAESKASIKAVITAEDQASKVLTGFAGKVESVGNKIVNTAKFAVKAVTTAGIAAVAFAIKSASAYEQNRIAFDTMLGSVEKGSKMMKELSDFAKRTPFDLPQVVEGAQRLLAYNIEADRLIPTLEALGNIAAAVGKEKLPFLILALGQVRAAGKLTGAELRQFTEAGVPLLELLGKQSGKTAGEIKQAMEDGAAPSFKEVEKALFDASAEGGKFFNLMEKQSKTFGGVMSNIRDQFGRVARSMVGINEYGNIREGSVFALLKLSASDFYDWLNSNSAPMQAKLDDIFDGLAQTIKTLVDAFESGGLKGAFEELWKIISEFIDKIDFRALSQKLTEGLITVFASIPYQRLASEAVKIIIKAVPQIIDGIIDGLISVATQNPMDLVKFFLAIGFLPGKVVTAISRVLKRIPLGGRLVAWMLEGTKKVASFILGPIQKLFASVGSKIMLALEFRIAQGLNKIKAIFGDGLNKVINGAFWWWQEIKSLFVRGITELFNIGKSLGVGIFNIFKGIFDNGVAIWKRIFGFIISGFSRMVASVRVFMSNFAFNIGEGIGKAVGHLIKFIIQTLPNIILTIIRWFSQLPGAIFNILTRAFQFVFSLFSRIRNTSVNAVVSLVNNVLAWFRRMPGSILSVLNTIYRYVVTTIPKAGRALVTGFINGVKAVASSIWGALSSTFNQIGRFFAGVGSWLWDSGAALIRGFVSGIKSVAGEPVEAVKGIVRSVKDWLPGSPAKKGPFSGKGWTPYRGKALTEGFAEGIRSAQGKAIDASKGLATGVSAVLGGSSTFGQFTTPSTTNQSKQSVITQPTKIASGGQQSINININVGAFMGSQQDARKFAIYINKALADAQQARGSFA